MLEVEFNPITKSSWPEVGLMDINDAFHNVVVSVENPPPIMTFSLPFTDAVGLTSIKEATDPAPKCAEVYAILCHTTV